METTKYEIELDNNAEDEFDWELANDEIANWAVEANVSHFMIEGKAMGWTRAEGFIVVPFDKLADALAVNGDYRIVFTVATGEDACTAIRYSHDEPVGASFSIRPATETEIEEW